MQVYEFTLSMTVPCDSGECDTADLVGRKWKMRELYVTVRVVVGPLMNCELKAFA